jgi:Raf kinase inhibitor-like YbhB/YbcL family protein
MKRKLIVFVVVAFVACCVGCHRDNGQWGVGSGQNRVENQNVNVGGNKVRLKVTSAAFAEGAAIPSQYTCDGRNVSPPLTWEGVPASAKTLALIADDPDAQRGVWTHWVVFNLPASERGLTEAVPATETLANGAKQGKNDFGNAGYGGPCPPSGTHRYYFKLYALDGALSLPSDATKDQLLKAMEDHIVAEGQLMGRYQRAKH